MKDVGAMQTGYLFIICLVQKQICKASYCILNFSHSKPSAQCPYHCTIMFMINCLPTDTISKWRMQQKTGRPLQPDVKNNNDNNTDAVDKVC